MAEKKVRIVSKSYESGENYTAIARHHALTPQHLFGWSSCGCASKRGHIANQTLESLKIKIFAGGRLRSAPINVFIW
jgi:transposase-like protein